MSGKMKPNNKTVLSSEVRFNKKLTPRQMVLYAEIVAHCASKGYCWATNKYLAGLFGVCTKTISRGLANLKYQGLIRIEFKPEYGGSRQIYPLSPPQTITSNPRANIVHGVGQYCTDQAALYLNSSNNDLINEGEQGEFISPPQVTRKESKAFFKRPLPEEVAAYWLTQQPSINQNSARREAKAFVDFYNSNDWKVGKNPMANWKAAVNTWINRNLRTQEENLSIVKSKSSKGGSRSNELHDCRKKDYSLKFLSND